MTFAGLLSNYSKWKYHPVPFNINSKNFRLNMKGPVHKPGMSTFEECSVEENIV